MVIDCGLSRVPRYEPDVGLTRLETVRVSRAAADQRRGRAGRTEPGVCYRLWDEPQTGSLEPYTQAGNSLGRPVLLRARSRAMGHGRSGHARVSRSAASGRAHRGADACCASSAPSTRMAASPTKAGACARCRCRRGWRAWWSTRRREGAGGLAAEIAAVLTERGLGGDDVDLRHRLDQFRRDRSRRARGCAGDGEAVGGAARRRHACSLPRCTGEGWGGGPPPDELRSSTSPASGGGEESVGALLALAYPDRIAKNRGGGAGGFLLANGRGGHVDAASPLGARAVPGGRRTGRQRGGQPHRAGGADHARRNRGALRRRKSTTARR